MGAALSLSLLLSVPVTAQQPDPISEPSPLARGYRTRALAGGWGHSWLHGWPGYGKAITDIECGSSATTISQTPARAARTSA